MPFLPTARQTNILLAMGFLSLGYALYLRYLAIEHAPVAHACDAGMHSFACVARAAAAYLGNKGILGWAALGAAALNVLRPTFWLAAPALALASAGLVLYNASLAGLALGLLILSLARPAPVAARPPAPAEPS